MIGWKRKKLFLLAVLVAMISPSLYFGFKHLHSWWHKKQFMLITPRRILYRFYNINSQQSCQDITAFLQPKFFQLNPLNFDNKQLLKDLGVHFPFIKDFSGTLTTDRDFVVSVHAYKFPCTINNNYVLTPKGLLLDKKIVLGEKKSFLPNITVDKHDATEKKQKALARFIKKVTHDVWQHFSIVYHSPWCIDLIPITSVLPGKIVCKAATIFDKEKLEELSNVCADFLQKIQNNKTFPKKENLYVCLDTRFDKKIIVKFYSMKKGGGLKK